MSDANITNPAAPKAQLINADEYLAEHPELADGFDEEVEALTGGDRTCANPTWERLRRKTRGELTPTQQAEEDAADADAERRETEYRAAATANEMPYCRGYEATQELLKRIRKDPDFQLYLEWEEKLKARHGGALLPSKHEAREHDRMLLRLAVKETTFEGHLYDFLERVSWFYPDDAMINGVLTRLTPDHPRYVPWDQRCRYLKAEVDAILTGIPRPTGAPTGSRSVAELLKDEAVLVPPEVVVSRLAWRNRTVLFAGREKWAGKSTILTAAAAAVTRGGPFLGARCATGAVLWVSADLEPEADIVQRFIRFGGDPERLFVVYPSGATYDARLTELDRELGRRRPAWVVIDSLAHFALVEEASQAAGWIAALMPLRALTQRYGTAVTVVHHTPKASQDEYRDSTAIGGAVDQVIIYSNPDRAKGSTRRKVNGIGRIVGWRPFEIELVEDRFVLSEGELPPAVGLMDEAKAWVAAHPRCSTKAVAEGIHARKEDAQDALDRLEGAGVIQDEGTGKPGAPRLWIIKPASTI